MMSVDKNKGDIDRLEKSAKNALAQLTDVSELKINRQGIKLYSKLKETLRLAASASSLEQNELKSIVGDIEWITLSMETFAMLDNDPSGPTVSCSTKCRNEYDDCLNQECSEGDKDDWFCLCCSSCGIDYTFCRVKCAGGGSFNNGFGRWFGW